MGGQCEEMSLSKCDLISYSFLQVLPISKRTGLGGRSVVGCHAI